MTKRRSTKSALLMSVLSLVVCVAMLVGTTFAWFTDSVTSKNNVIKAGNLDVELEYAKVVDGAATAWSTVEGKSDIFDPEALWEPGRVEVVYLKVSNLGNLALKYQLSVTVFNEIAGINVAGDPFKLSEHLVFKVVEMPDTLTTYDDRDAITAAAGTELGMDSYTSKTTSLEVGGVDYVALIVYMPESVGNEANYRGDAIPTIELGVDILATQASDNGTFDAEDDSFGGNYDKDAWVDGMSVSSAKDLQSALNNGATHITIEEDIVTDETITVPAGSNSGRVKARAISGAVVIDLNGKSISVAEDKKTTTYAITNLGNLVLMDSVGGGSVNSRGIYNGSETNTAAKITVLSGTYNALGTDGGAAIFNYGTANIKGGTFTSVGGYSLNSRTGATMIIDNASVTGGIYNEGALTVNDGDIKTDRGGYTHAIYSNGGSVEINGGNFSGNGNEVINSYSDVAIINGGTFQKVEKTSYLLSGSNMVINNGTFLAHESNPAGHPVNSNVTVNGGTFNYNHTNVSEGRKTVEVAGNYIVVSEEIKDENVVGSSDKLSESLGNAGSAGAGDNTIILGADIDLGGEKWESISVDGYNGAGVITIDGNGHTITGLTSPLFAGGFAGNSGIVIKNLTIADSNIVSTSGLGGGAFIDSADSMHVITLENCHLVNSTVTGERTGGLIGWCTGYAKLDDGPVKAYVTIKNCSVVDSKVIGAGSAGAIAGHPGASDYTYTTIEDCAVKNVDVVSNDDGSWRTGAIVGTANNGHIVINNVSVENVTLTQNGVIAEDTQLFGRFVPAGTGTLVIDGATVVTDAAMLLAAIEEGAVITPMISGTTVKLPASMKNVTFKNGYFKNGGVMSHDGNFISYEGVTFDGVTFDNARITFTGWRTNGAIYKDLTVANCIFKNLDDTTNTAPLHINVAVHEAVNGLTFVGNVIDGATGGSKSGVYSQVTGKTVFADNVINNVAFRPYVIQVTVNDSIDDEFIVTGNTFSGSSAGRAQGLGNDGSGTDAVKLVVSGNIFKDITNAQHICYWNFNPETTEADLSGNYYDVDITENTNKIYYNGSAGSVEDLVEMGVYPFYTELNEDGTINLDSIVVAP